MAIQIHDTLAGEKVEFRPIVPGKVGLYVCGPTVYDHAHLGPRPLLRGLGRGGAPPARPRTRGEVRAQLHRRRRQDHHAGQRAGRGSGGAGRPLRRRPSSRTWTRWAACAPTWRPRVTGTMPGIVALIERLVARGFAYAPGNGDVYYAVRKFPAYGQLSRRNLDDLLAGARVEPGEAKRDPLDFALWKGAKPGEPRWDSPVGEGAAGLAHRVLGHDARAPGRRPSTSTPAARTWSSRTTPTRSPSRSAALSATGCDAEDFARHWMHNGFVEIDHEKMSKSLGNFFTVKDVLERHDGEALRLFLLGTHYRNPINFSDGLLGDAERRLGYLYETLEKADRHRRGRRPGRGPGRLGRGGPGRARRRLQHRRRCWASWPRPSPPPTPTRDRKGKKTPGRAGGAGRASPATPGRWGASWGSCSARRPGRSLELRGQGGGPARHRPGAGRGPDRRAGRGPAGQGLRPLRRGPRRAGLALGVTIQDGPAGTTWKVE